jgi:hypothetical protein
MMVRALPFLMMLIMVVGCGGSLNEEQRKRLRENMEKGAIKRVPDAELTAAALTLARQVVSQLSAAKPLAQQAAKIDSLEKAFDVKITSLAPNDSLLSQVEKQIIDAYTAAAPAADLPDNLQRLGPDSLLYTKPQIKTNADGSVEFTYALGIRMAKRTVILSM